MLAFSYSQLSLVASTLLPIHSWPMLVLVRWQLVPFSPTSFWFVQAWPLRQQMDRLLGLVCFVQQAVVKRTQMLSWALQHSPKSSLARRRARRFYQLSPRPIVAPLKVLRSFSALLALLRFQSLAGPRVSYKAVLQVSLACHPPSQSRRKPPQSHYFSYSAATAAS